MHLNRVHITTAAVVIAFGATALPATGSASGPGVGVRPNADEQLLTTRAESTPAAQPAVQSVQPNPDQQTQVATNTRQPIASTPAVIVRVSAAKSGFDWGDAGIGAAGALGLSLIALVGWLAASRHRARRTGSLATSH
jgi:hypothetical protein